MSAQLTCQLYCSPPRSAAWVQMGWWPDTLACDECKDKWDELCQESDGCMDNATWFASSAAFKITRVS